MGIEVHFANGLRKIKPYYHSRTCFAKGRWLNRTLLDVLSNEFRTLSRDDYLNRIIQKDFQLIREGEPLSVEQTLNALIQNKDLVKTTDHKHEPPVRQWSADELTTATQIAGMDIIHEDENFLVINKPCGIPVHPTGQYFQNTITEILSGAGKTAFPTHRLDKITSGVLILAKNCYTANKIQAKIRSRDMRKVYLARVRGMFPHASSDIQYFSSDELFQQSDKVTKVDSPIFTVEPKKRFRAGLSPAREATTNFYPIRYIAASDETVVACQPLTGRTHQIRIHLARLGHAISNDPFYNYQNTLYPKRLQFMLDVENWETSGLSENQLSERFHEFVIECEELQKRRTQSEFSEKCMYCGTPSIPDPAPETLELYLHAWKYSDIEGKLSFESALPKWASEHDTK